MQSAGRRCGPLRSSPPSFRDILTIYRLDRYPFGYEPHHAGANWYRHLPSRASRQHMLTDSMVSAYADAMESSLAITEAASGSDPDAGLRAVAGLRALAERLEILQVDNARRAGWSWQEIATRLGVTKQTVHRKHGKRAGSR
jgi:hypothetical protein